MYRPHRRHILAVSALTGLGLVTGIDTAAAERENIAATLDEIAASWETATTQAVLPKLYAIDNKVGIIGRRGLSGDWARLSATTLVMLAQAQADVGQPSLAADTAMRAMHAAYDGGHRTLEAHARAISGEIYNSIAPKTDTPIEMLAQARQLGGRTQVAVQAAALETYARAARGEPQTAVVPLLRAAEQVQAQLPASAGWPAWTPAHLHAFGGIAAVLCGARALASEWLQLAADEAAGMPSLGVAVDSYRAQGCASAGDWDAARSYALDAVGVACSRGAPPAWLKGRVASLARSARGRGGDWSGLRAVAA